MLTQIVWIVLAAVLSFSIAAIFAGWLKLRRGLYLVFYIVVMAAFFVAFIVSNDVDVTQILSYNWYWGLLGAVAAGALAIGNVLSQPASKRRTGRGYVADLLWPGFSYGLIDALILSVLPILAIRQAFDGAAWTDGFAGQIGLGALALAASFFVTALYHLGYPEYRNKRVFWTMMGNGIFSVAYLLTMNPLAAILPHIAMHMTAMTHGRETTGQVPPHYEKD